jgi:serpin B
MFLINAIYFKGTWTYKFNPELTGPGNFYHPAGNSVPCQFMHQEGIFSYQINEEIQAVELPYGNGDFRMAIILPRNQAPLNSIIQNLSEEQLYHWLNRFHEQDGILEFPKFKFAYEKILNSVLSNLGMAIAFDPERADFTNLYDGPGKAFISEVKHKSFIQVDEEGTEAAAATSVTITLTSAGDAFYMRVDRPFIFVLYDNHSKTILFIGKITQPVWEN